MKRRLAVLTLALIVGCVNKNTCGVFDYVSDERRLTYCVGERIEGIAILSDGADSLLIGETAIKVSNPDRFDECHGEISYSGTLGESASEFLIELNYTRTLPQRMGDFGKICEAESDLSD